MTVILKFNMRHLEIFPNITVLKLLSLIQVYQPIALIKLMDMWGKVKALPEIQCKITALFKFVKKQTHLGKRGNSYHPVKKHTVP